MSPGHSKNSTPDPTCPAKLEPVFISKPWGREIWYTGMEARGESRVHTGGQQIPISHYLHKVQGNTDVLLLKVLDPAPQTVTGDLYFEVHEEKREVYIVTHVDAHAWPAGQGAIRFGMNQAKRQQFADDQAFRGAYLGAVQNYAAIRQQIDHHGKTIPAAEEQQARAAMEAFTQMRALSVGDVVRVPTWTPHALQHGVRVVEFQTPTYERYIISFAQKVVTQDHWDSAHAIAHMHLDAPAAEQFEQVGPGIERIASFADFNVWRADLSACGGELTLPKQLPYAVCMSLAQSIQICGQEPTNPLELAAEEACFVPRAALAQLSIRGPHGQVLIAAPGL
ncbi:MAG: hypothetical protein AAF993_01730 [Pseudomonadota bacterium]